MDTSVYVLRASSCLSVFVSRTEFFSLLEDLGFGIEEAGKGLLLATPKAPAGIKNREVRWLNPKSYLEQ